jgi:hypothetical protein
MPRRLAAADDEFAAADDDGLTKSRASPSTSIGCDDLAFLSLPGRRWTACPPRGKAASGVAGGGRDLEALTAGGALEFGDLRAIFPPPSSLRFLPCCCCCAVVVETIEGKIEGVQGTAGGKGEWECVPVFFFSSCLFFKKGLEEGAGWCSMSRK